MRFYASLRWVNATDLGSVSGASNVIADHYVFAIFVAAALHERPGSLRNPIAILFIFRIVKPGTSSRNPRENRPNKMAKKIAFKAAQISRLTGDFPVFHIYIFIATAEKKWQCGISMI